MIESKSIKIALRAQLKTYYLSQWAHKVAEQCDQTADSVRRYFKGDVSNERIMLVAKKIVAEAKELERIEIENLESK